MTVKVDVSFPRDAFEKAFHDNEPALAKAMTLAVNKTAAEMLAAGRGAVATSGLGPRFTNALRMQTFPGKDSLRPAALVWHRIPYAQVFEDGATIRGKPLLWIPVGRTRSEKQRARAAAKGAQLFTLNRPGKPPLLARRVGKETEVLLVGVPDVTIRARMKLREALVNAAGKLATNFSF